MLFEVVMSGPREDMNLVGLQETLSRLADSIMHGQQDSARALKLAQDLDAQIIGRVAAGGVITAPMADIGVSPTPQNRKQGSRDGDQ